MSTPVLADLVHNLFYNLFQILDRNYFFGKDVTEPAPPSVPLQWALDLMCEKLRGVSIWSLSSFCISLADSLADSLLIHIALFVQVSKAISANP